MAVCMTWFRNLRILNLPIFYYDAANPKKKIVSADLEISLHNVGPKSDKNCRRGPKVF